MPTRIAKDADHIYGYLRAKTGSQKKPVIIIPDVLGGSTTKSVVRAMLEFHDEGYPVYVPYSAGAQGTMCTKKYDIF